MKKETKEQGITLIALIVTIIILVILAAITINAIVGEYSIIGTAKDAGELGRIAEAEEDVKLAWEGCSLEYMISGMEKNLPKKDFFTKERLNKSLVGGEAVEVKYSEDKTVPSEVTYRTRGKRYYEYKIQIAANGEVSAVETGTGDNPVRPTPPAEGWTVEQAKELVARDGLKAHLGEKVAYNSKAGGTWRIFYYDDEDQGNGKGYFGDNVGTVYLIRDYTESLVDLTKYTSYNPTDGGAVMRQMNPKWAKGPHSVIDQENEHCAAWLCDPTQWTDSKVEVAAKYAIGSPSVEMYMKSYNAYKESNSALINKLYDGEADFNRILCGSK